MAEITDEIQALRDFVADIGFTRVWMQHMPTVYTAGELTIRFLGDVAQTETGYHYRLDRDYQFVVFGTSERDCITKANAIQRRLRGVHKINVGESGWLTLDSFSLSEPFKAEDSDVYGIIGILQAAAREARHFAPVPKIQQVDATVSPISSTTGEPVDEEFDANTGRNGAD